MAFRFHLHEHSPKECDLDSTRREQQLANAKNERLAKKVDQYFYEDAETVEGYFVGGTNKQEAIMGRGCPVKLLKQPYGPTLLAVLLDRAYALLRQHYSAINFRDLEPYAVELPDRPLRKDLHEAKPPTNAEDRFCQRGIELGNNKSVKKPPVPPPDDTKRVLDNHEAMCLLFRDVFRDEDGNPIDINPHRGDKFFDQFDCIKAITGEDIKNDIGTSRLGKRKSSSGQEPNKKPKLR